MRNTAYIDGQNLHMGTARLGNAPWHVDLVRFRRYLREKYSVGRALYFLGNADERYGELYEKVRNAGFELRFKPHGAKLASQKKGNVDADIIFDVMKRLYRKEDCSKIVLVSGDGDYKILVDFLLEEGLLEKMIAPCRARASSLYRTIRTHYFECLDDPGIRKKVEKG
jgi:uncharacterized LabA/DUF88 family protein